MEKGYALWHINYQVHDVHIIEVIEETHKVIERERIKERGTINSFKLYIRNSLFDTMSFMYN